MESRCKPFIVIGVQTFRTDKSFPHRVDVSANHIVDQGKDVIVAQSYIQWWNLYTVDAKDNILQIDKVASKLENVPTLQTASVLFSKLGVLAYASVNSAFSFCCENWNILWMTTMSASVRGGPTCFWITIHAVLRQILTCCFCAI